MDMEEKKISRVAGFKLYDTIGKGSYSKVKLAEHEVTGTRVAIKIIDRNQQNERRDTIRLEREISILKNLDHPHLIKLFDVFESDEKIFLVMEYVPGGELYDHIVQKKFSEEEALKIFAQLMKGVNYLHQRNVVHRDLKLENILLDSRANVKVGDFGFATVTKQGEFMSTSCGSPYYVAPEVIREERKYTEKVDIWSCGVILYALVTGVLPFSDRHIPIIFDHIRAGKYDVPTYLPPAIQELIKSLLVVDPDKRPSSQKILEHPLIQGYCKNSTPRRDSTEKNKRALQKFMKVYKMNREEALATINGDQHQALKLGFKLLCEQFPVDETCEEKARAPTLTFFDHCGILLNRILRKVGFTVNEQNR